ncbi:MAG: hypothetical protein IJE89_01450 [Bacilli bacterium]|nr:hypothetical protein [Bacilli bacterium]
MDIRKNINNNVDNNTDNSGDNRGKFSDRLKKIRKDKMLAKRGIKSDTDEPIIKTGARNVLKIVLAMPSVIYTNIKSTKGKNDVKFDDSNLSYDGYNSSEVKRIKVNRIREINISLLKEKKKIYLKGKKEAILSKTKLLTENEIKVQNLQKEIIGLIKKRLVKNLNELEVLKSELYVLSELTGDRLRLAECEEDIKEIKKLLSKIKSLKEKYDYLKDNLDFEYMLEYGEDFLVDKILELKELCSSDDVRYIIDNYKLLDEYKYLYLKIDKLQEDAIKLEEHKNKEIEELKERDIDFEKFKNEVYNVDRENDRYMDFVQRQESFLKELEGKISKIDSHEVVSYRLKGFNQLLGNSFKYLGLLLVSPLKGLIPGIATQTLITKNMIQNMCNNLEWEENRKMVYDAIDYTESINRAVGNLDDTSNLVNSTLEDIVRLKENYQKKFSSYEREMPAYKNAIKKINKIENAILGSKLKIDLVKTQMKEKERQNSNKLKMVRKLNNSQNNSGNN